MQVTHQVTHVVHHRGYRIAQPKAGSFRADKYGQVMDGLRTAARHLQIHAPDPMPVEWITAVHEPAYVEEVLACAVPPAKERRIGFAIGPAVRDRALLSCGGTWLAARIALRHGYAANTAGGSHHALAESGAGYCVLNDLAIAAHRLIAEGDAQRILILDLDVHQGDGTASLMAGRPDVFTLSIHAERNFPARKARSSLDIGLPDGTGDADYLAVLAANLGQVLDDFAPDLILYQAGVDTHADDRLGRLALSDAGLVARDRHVMGQAQARGIPLASTLGGGYGDDVAAVAQRHATTILTLAENAQETAAKAVREGDGA